MMKNLKGICGSCLLVVVLFLVPAPAGADNCRLYGVISEDLPEGLLQKHLLIDPFSLEELSRVSNVDGWGIGYVPPLSDTALFARGAVRAWKDPRFESTVLQLDALGPRIVIGHIRNCTTGCCAHGEDTIVNPHPFSRDLGGKRWFFAHNGEVDIDRTMALIGDEFLAANPPDGSGIPECAANVSDSEYYFLFLLKKIQENGGDTVKGIREAIRDMVGSGEKGTLNFIMSDGRTMWAFRRTTSANLTSILLPHRLYYLYDRRKDYSAVASQYPTLSKGSWTAINNYELMVFSPDQAPVKVRIDPGS